MSDQYIGEIRIFPFGWAPQGWAACNGALLPVRQYPTLLAVVGNQYGGDGKTTFGLPNLQGCVVAGGTVGQLGQTWGKASVTLDMTHTPAHSHSAQVAIPLPTEKKPGKNIPARVAATNNMIYEKNVDTTLSMQTVVPAGNGMAHDNMQPYLGLAFYIATEGNYPPKPS